MTLPEKIARAPSRAREEAHPARFRRCAGACLLDQGSARHERHRPERLRPGGGQRAGARGAPAGVARPEGTPETIAADGQIRLWWDETPVDLFFDYEPVHADAARHAQKVPFAGTRIPILGPIELTVFKVMFDRTRDWADVEAMVAANTVDLDAVRATLATLLEPDDERFDRLTEAVRRADAASASGGGAAPAVAAARCAAAAASPSRAGTGRSTHGAP